MPSAVMVADTTVPLKDSSVCFPKRKNQFFEIVVSTRNKTPTDIEDDAWDYCDTVMAKVRNRDDALKIAKDYANKRFVTVFAVLLR
jgi:hypothetical protein